MCALILHGYLANHFGLNTFCSEKKANLESMVMETQKRESLYTSESYVYWTVHHLDS